MHCSGYNGYAHDGDGKFVFQILSKFVPLNTLTFLSLLQASDKVRAGLVKGVPLKRFGTPGEFASLCVQIVDNGYLNGELIRLDGNTFCEFVVNPALTVDKE